MEHLPFGPTIEKGMKDLACQNETIESLLVSIGYPRLSDLGFEFAGPGIPNPEIKLYLLLSKTLGNGAHSRYNSLVRRLVSFERAYPIASKTKNQFANKVLTHRCNPKNFEGLRLSDDGIK